MLLILDFRQEMESRHFCACAIKNLQNCLVFCKVKMLQKSKFAAAEAVIRIASTHNAVSWNVVLV